MPQTGRTAIRTPELAELANIRTLPELLAWRAAKSPDAEAYRQFDTVASRWQSTNWAQAGQSVGKWCVALAALQLPAGARIAILLPNGLDAVFIDQAALALGYVTVPLHAIDNPDSIAYIVNDSDASFLILDSADKWGKIVAAGIGFPALKQVVVTEDSVPASSGAASTIAVSTLKDWLGKSGSSALPSPPTADDLASIVYTSGTTGKPKGVMLTHNNVVFDVKATLARVAPTIDDVFLSFLPLSHTFERTAGYYLPMAIGCCVAYARSVALLAEDLKTVRPTILISVPRIYERIYSKLTEILSQSSLKAGLFAWAQAVGWRRFCGVQKLPHDAGSWSFLDPVVWPLLEKLIAEPLLAQFGGRVRVAVSGGAPLSIEIAHCFLGLGLPLLQGYGMTETSPVIAANGLNDNDPLTVGRALDGIEFKIGERTELLVRGPCVMKGYWKRPADTELVLSADGWLKTGDMAAIEGGRVRIMGRIKEIIVTSTGEKVPPGDLELAITNDNLFEQAFVVGENRPFIAAIVVLNRNEWNKLAAELHVDPDDPASLNATPVRQALQQRIAQHTKTFPSYAVPRAVLPTLTPWTIENALMTPTLKLKRNNLMTKFAGEIENLYRPRAKTAE